MRWQAGMLGEPDMHRFGMAEQKADGSMVVLLGCGTRPRLSLFQEAMCCGPRDTTATRYTVLR